jgi:hypothetical protein
MNTIVEYRCLSAVTEEENLDDKVNALIKQGFQPFAGVAITVHDDTVRFAQVMVKYGVEAPA